LGALWEALRIAREEVVEVVEVVVAIRVRQIAPRWGRRNRGIEVVGGILKEPNQLYPSSPSRFVSVCSVSRENFRCCQSA
jgi:hypothetical protein